MAQRLRLLAAGLAALTLAGSAAAQPETRRTTTTTTTTTEFRRASGVMNANVVVQDGATVGKITDFVISDGGCIEYVVVDYDNKYVLVPYQVVRVDGERHVVQVSITQEKFREIPTFTGTNWPLTDQQYIGKVRTVFGVTESGYRGDRRDGDRRPMDRTDDRRDDRRDARPTDRRDQPTPPQQRRDVENPNRNPTPPPSNNPPTTRPPDPTRNPPPPPADRPPADRPTDRSTDRDRPRTPPPPPPGTPGTNPPQPPDRDRPPV
jgi:rRNA processing protein Gar1